MGGAQPFYRLNPLFIFAAGPKFYPAPASFNPSGHLKPPELCPAESCSFHKKPLKASNIPINTLTSLQTVLFFWTKSNGECLYLLIHFRVLPSR